MTEKALEELLRNAPGQQPRVETTDAVLQAASKPVNTPTARAIPKPALVVFTPAPRSRWPLYLGAAAAIVLVGCGVWLLLPETPVTVGSTMDAMQVKRDGKILRLEPNVILLAGDTLLPGSRARFLTNDGSLVKTDGNATVLLQKPHRGERVRIQLQSGRVYVRASASPLSFIVDAGATVRVVGTWFGVGVSSGTCEVNVLEGTVEVAQGRAALNVTRGQSAMALAGAAPSLTAIDPNTALLWTRDYTTFTQRPCTEVLRWIEQNSSYRFVLPHNMRDRNVSIAVADEPPREVIEIVLISCGLNYKFSEFDVIVREP
ncbi:MAG TPA: FecR domain-containing protein [Planctomycetota bacterium]|nr:FecR domain-containing protein [Planctomycetota bacterium]